ncbi:MarR family winged helix-turn-helix transcriptional regulator [Sphingomonas sp. CL5.1]|uniref:MarR family winged helix-turn-helix transcriptional regulator n=1 Tax=Sphingomonas sp. CL5.1 TaxID=2653203 RepID=UPI001C2E2BAA|nr:MarR family transcriptional regulator [Sphingomonas sp. CL5.1]
MRSDASLYAFTNSLQPVRRAWTQAAGRVLAGMGLSTSLATVVLLASRLGPHVQQKILALELGINPAALVRLLDQGEAAGVLVRNDVEGDRRSKAIELLPEGRRLAERMERTLAELRRQLLGDVPRAEIDAATRMLRLLEERAARWLRDDRVR